MPQWLHNWTVDDLAHSPRLWLDLTTVIVLLLLSGRLTRYKWPFIIFVLPGTIAHELAHWSMALLFGGQPKPPSLQPQTAGQRWTLGHVVIRNPRWYNLPQIALAPLLLLPLAALAYWHWLRFYPLTTWQHWLGLYCIAMLIRSSIPSSEDFRLLLRYRLPLLILGCLGLSLFIALRK
ncbi:MAG TPA: hypothetical protein VLC91_01305 [Spongiibacteraceae bacterium]|nr:hypothetical protein [Spongiibacteraceae bacterium]